MQPVPRRRRVGRRSNGRAGVGVASNQTDETNCVVDVCVGAERIVLSALWVF